MTISKTLMIAVLTIWSATIVQAAVPRGQVEVAGEIVTVGDLFADAGPAAESPVFYAPDPGSAVEIGPNFLHRVALGFDLDWTPGGGIDRVVVRRAAQTIGLDELEPVLMTALGARIGPQFSADLNQISFDSGIATRYLPVDIEPAMTARDLSYDPRSQRFSAVVDVAQGTAYAVSLRASGRLRSVVMAPVLIRAVARDEAIGPSDIHWIEVDSERLASNVLLDADRLIGLNARRALPPNQPITEADVISAVAVVRGDLVTMVLESGTITLTAQARALDNGAAGDVIRVTNTQSSRTVEAIVESAGVVRVRAPGDAIGSAIN